MRRLAGLALAGTFVLLFDVPAVVAHDGDVSLALGGLEVTQSIQTFPQSPGVTVGASVPLTSHKPAVIRAYVDARRYLHLNFGFFTFHFPTYASVSVNGTLTVLQGGSTIATLPASNGPISVTPWASPDPSNPNSSLNFEWAFPADGTVTFQLDLTSLTAGIPAVDPPAENRTFAHNRRVRIQGVKLQYNHDNNLATPPTKTPDPTLAANGTDWMLKSGPLAPCKLQYWVNPTPLQTTTDLTLTTSGGLLSTLAGMKTQGSITYDNVYGWWQGGVAGNGYAQNPSCASPPSSGAYGNTELSRYQRTFTHEVYHNYCEVHVSETLGVVGWDTTLDAPVPSSKFDVMVAGQLTTAAWQSPTRYSNMYGRWLATSPESFFDPCHFDWWELVPLEVFLPFGLLPPEEQELQPVDVLVVGGVIFPDGKGSLEPAWSLKRAVMVPDVREQGEWAVQLIDMEGKVVGERQFTATFEGDGDPHVPLPSSFTFEMRTPMDAAGAPNLSEIRLVRLGKKAGLLDALRRSPNLPAVQILSPDPRQMPVLDRPFMLMAEAADPDGGSHVGSLQYSPDDGQHWLPLANRIPVEDLGSFPIDPAGLPGGSLTRLRLLVSDGVNTGESEVGTFQVPRKGTPEVAIRSPEPPSEQNPLPPIACELVPLSLVGVGSSPDDGVIPCQRLEWFSDVEGPLGTGCSIEARLKAGDHFIELSAADRGGAVARAGVTVQVLPATFDRDRDGTPDCADRCPNEPGPPENGGCPYDPTTQPLSAALKVTNSMGGEQGAFASFFDVFFEVEIGNPRTNDVQLLGLRFHLNDPQGGSMSADFASPMPLPAGTTVFVRGMFFDVFTELKALPDGGYSLVVEPLLGPNEPSGRDDGFFAVDASQAYPIARIVPSDPAPSNGSRIAACTHIDMGSVPDPLGSYGARLSWDPQVLQFMGYTGGQPPFDTPTVNTANAGAGLLSFADADAAGASGDVFVACFEFQVAGSEGSRTPLDLELTSIFTAGSFVDLLPVAAEIDGSVDVGLACRIGDVNGDGAINSGDALIVLSNEIGLPIPDRARQAIAAGCGDANGDGATDSTDAAIILAFEVGLPISPNFPIGRTNQTLDRCPFCGGGALQAGSAAASTPAPRLAAESSSDAIVVSLRSSGTRLRPGDSFEVTVALDLGAGGRRLGSYAADLRFDPKSMRFEGLGASGFAAPVVNDREAGSGRLRFAAADPVGAGGGVDLVRLRFTALRGMPDPARGLDLRFTSVGGAAPDFPGLLPHLIREPSRPGRREGER